MGDTKFGQKLLDNVQILGLIIWGDIISRPINLIVRKLPINKINGSQPNPVFNVLVILLKNDIFF